MFNIDKFDFKHLIRSEDFCMDVNLARTFLAVVESGSFIEAANLVHVTQSTVSSRIKTLEDLIGQTLFVRTKAGAKLTRAGLQFQKHALAIGARMGTCPAGCRASRATPRSLFTVGAQISLWDGLHVEMDRGIDAREYALTSPSPHPSAIRSTALMERLLEGTLDLGVMYRPVHCVRGLWLSICSMRNW